MKAYLYTTGTLFALIVVAHVCRMYVEPHLLRDPIYHALTLLSASLSIWAWRLTR
ncbi:MAG: hypothetical protein KDB23_01805 [Planctomycetales bacterium]|nr:hypothetical protein [Planctomycetales bacterium]